MTKESPVWFDECVEHCESAKDDSWFDELAEMLRLFDRSYDRIEMVRISFSRRTVCSKESMEVD